MHLCPAVYVQKLLWGVTPQEWGIGYVHLLRHCQIVPQSYLNN